MQPLYLLCGCPYSAVDIPGLPATFVRQCDVHLADEFVAFQAHGEFVMQAQCLDILTDQSLIPWICPFEHDAIFESAGELNRFARKVKKNCAATSTLLEEVIELANASLPQVRLLAEALSLLQKAPESLDGVRKTALQMRDQAMREYLGFWWYFSVWKKSEAPAIQPELEKLAKNVQRRDACGDSEHPCSGKSESTDSRYESTSSVATDRVRPRLTVAADPMIINDNPLTVLDAFERTNDYPTSWILYSGNDPSIIIARRMRRLFLKADSIFKNCVNHPEELLEAAIIHDVELPDLALFLMEQTVLNECLDKKTRFHLQNSSDTHLELLSESAATAWKDAANKMLKNAVRIWRVRYARYKSKTLIVPVMEQGDSHVMLQIVPESITDFVHGDDPVVIRNVDPIIRVSR